MKPANDWKERLNVVYSTNPDFAYETIAIAQDEHATLPPEKQRLHLRIERHHRGGKTATIVSGFVGTENDLEKLAKQLKTKCGIGGTTKNGEIILQGELADKLKTVLAALDYKVK